jgi:mannose-6-phosphate isomerase-like protein (cupin superfamily)
MIAIAKEDDLRLGTGRTARFEGESYGSGISFFHVYNVEGQGPSAHVHTYSETWVVLAGSALIRTADGEVTAVEGDVVVVGAGTAHAFRAVGPEPLRMMCIHASPRIEQEFLDEATASEVGVTF